MKKILFACDMDNTLIHSRRLYRDGDVCVEMYEGREQSFMSPKAIQLLDKVAENQQIDFLPVTTRSIAQFSRITLPSAIQTALVSNGTIMLNNGIADEKWQSQSLSQVESYMSEMKSLCEKYAASGLFRTVKIVDGMFLFAARESRDGIYDVAAECAKETTLRLEVSGRKMYWFPPIADKGKALAKFRSMYEYDTVISAGDSSIDYPMLETADVALVPDNKTAVKINSADIRACSGENFAEFILEQALKICCSN